MRPAVLALIMCGLLVGCGEPSGVKAQAESIGSIAAEGALLAHDASEGSTTATYTRVHARALRDKADSLRSRAATDAVESLVERVSQTLERLEDQASNRELAADAERALERDAERADELAQAA